MSVRKKGQSWFFEFMIDGKRYNGTCIGAKNRDDAKDYADEERLKIKKYNKDKEKSEYSANRKKVKELRNELNQLNKTACIKIEDGYNEFFKIKAPRAGETNERNIYNDFSAFMKAKYSDVQYIDEVQKFHAQAYVSQLKTMGKFSLKRHQPLLNTSIRNNIAFIRAIFSVLIDVCNLESNPFSRLAIEKNEDPAKKPFTPEQIHLILSADDGFCVPLFKLALYTGMRCGDCCSLKWEEIDWGHNIISKIQNKTKNPIKIPMKAELRTFLLEQYENKSGDYILMEQNRLYTANPSFVTRKVKRFLQKIGIESEVKRDGRSSLARYGIHSCRHTWVSRAIELGFSTEVIKATTGHLSDSMLHRYVDVNDETKRRMVDTMPSYTDDVIDVEVVPTAPMLASADAERAEARQLMDTLDIEDVRKILAMYKR